MSTTTCPIQLNVLASGLSWADIAWYNLVSDFFPMGGIKISPDLKKLNAIVENVKKQPKIAAWVEKRPVTNM